MPLMMSTANRYSVRASRVRHILDWSGRHIPDLSGRCITRCQERVVVRRLTITGFDVNPLKRAEAVVGTHCPVAKVSISSLACFRP